jgi:uncharacterized repeat protein (TIGR03803 family)
MRCTLSLRRAVQSVIGALLFLVGVPLAYGVDSYNPSNKQLTLFSLAIGSANYSNMVVTVGSIVSGPSGTAPNGPMDSYDPRTNQLTVQSVTVGSATYHNAVVTVGSLVLIGAVAGADTFNGSELSISHVQVGGTVYDGVVLTEGLGNVISIAGGMPTFVPDTYNSFANRLAIPAVQVGSRVYTNVVVSLGTLHSVAGIHSSVQESVLHSFNGQNGTAGVSNSTDGADPFGGLIEDSHGNFYGTTYYGGQYDVGTVFKLAAGVESVIYSFTGPDNGGLGGMTGSTDGAHPNAGLVLDSAGNLYGTTVQGGIDYAANAGGHGTVFKITPQGVETILYAFCLTGCSDGELPFSQLILGADDNLYGTAGGGTSHGGIVYRMTLAGAETVLYSFKAATMDAVGPQAGVIRDSAGNLYGTADGGGNNSFGAMFKITPDGAESVIYSFCSVNTASANCVDGSYPSTGLIWGADGNIYGATGSGGLYDLGTVFRMTPEGNLTVMHSFCGEANIRGCTDGAEPIGSLLQASDGNFYGMTHGGGANDWGSIYKITPTGVETTTFSFQADNNANTSSLDPTAGLTEGLDGNFYGMTDPGGSSSEGTLFSLTNVIPFQ